MTELTIARLLETARTSDLYDLLAATLTVLAGRGDLDLEVDRIEAEHADISDAGGGVFVASYYAEACAELAMLERGQTEGGA